MTLIYKQQRVKEIIELAKNPMPESELYKMSFDELEELVEHIIKIAYEDESDEKLFGYLMRLKTYALLMKERKTRNTLVNEVNL